MESLQNMLIVEVFILRMVINKNIVNQVINIFVSGGHTTGFFEC